MEILKTRRDIVPPDRPGVRPGVFLDGHSFRSAVNTRAYVTGLVRLDTPLTPITESSLRLSASNSPVPIYGWLPSGTNGPLYWYCESPRVFLNGDTADMFQSFSALQTLDFTGISWSAGTTGADYMFEMCGNLTTIIAPGGTLTLSSSSGMFSGCSRLVGGAGTAYSASHTDGTYARIDNPPDFPGYFTRG